MDPDTQLRSTIDPSTQHQTTKAEFQQKYWFNSLQMVTVTNPLAEDWPFMVEMRHFIIRAGAKERFPGVIANVYLDQMSKILAQNDDKLGFMTDPNLRKIYFDKLIVSVEDLAPQYNPTPEYLRGVSPAAQGQAPSETAPWEEGMERARDVAPTINTPPPAPEPSTPPPATAPPKEPVEKNFAHDGHEYKMVVSKDGKEMFYRDGKLTSAAEYSKAASMI